MLMQSSQANHSLTSPLLEEEGSVESLLAGDSRLRARQLHQRLQTTQDQQLLYVLVEEPSICQQGR